MTNRRRPLSWIRSVKSRLAQHVKDKTTEYTTSRIQYTNPIETYFSAQRDQVAKRAPFLVLPSCLLPPSHAFATVDPRMTTATATPLFVHRDATEQSHNTNNNTVRAYVNTCRHRGARLIPQQPQLFSTTLIRGAALVCPYHAWTYDLTTGDLKGVPGEKFGFPCLDKSKHGLINHVDCFESAGGIWLGKKKKNDSSSSTTSSGWWPSIDSELSSLLPASSSSTNQKGNHNFVGYQEWNLNANWQLLVETFLESYHVKSLHKDTLGRVSHSNIMVTDVLDSHSLRMTVPLNHFHTNAPTLFKIDDDVDDDELESFLSQTTTTYFIFPNTAISLFKRFILFLSIVPSSADSSAAITSHDDDDEEHIQPSCKSHVRAWAIARNLPSSANDGDVKNHDGDDDAAGALARRDYESVIRGVEEDWECAEGIQSGLMAARRTAANNKSSTTTFAHGCFEGNNVAFLNHVGLVAQELRLQDRRPQER